jgi:hypothetical protein
MLFDFCQQFFMRTAFIFNYDMSNQGYYLKEAEGLYSK